MSNIIKRLLAMFAGGVRPLDLTPVHHDSGIPCPPEAYLRKRRQLGKRRNHK